MTAPDRTMTVEEFDAFTEQPENADKLFEFIGKEIVEVPSNAYSSKIASKINGYLFMYLLNNDIGHLTGEQGGYQIAGERYAPDVAFISYQRQPELAKKGYNPNPPELAVEILSSDDLREERRLTIKLGNYLYVGTTVWIVRPEENEDIIEVHEPGKKVAVLGKDDTVSAEHILPGFMLAVADILK